MQLAGRLGGEVQPPADLLEREVFLEVQAKHRALRLRELRWIGHHPQAAGTSTQEADACPQAQAGRSGQVRRRHLRLTCDPPGPAATSGWGLVCAGIFSTS